MKKLNKILTLIGLITLVNIAGLSQEVEQRPSTSRQVWIRLKSGPILTGDLVKMDPDSVDFKVKGVLQSIKCDELIGVMFVPPNPKPQQSQSQQPAPQQQEAKPQAQPAQLPDSCNRRSIQLAGGHYNYVTFRQNIRDFHYKGEFKANGGKISVYIVDNENYPKVLNGKKFNALYSLVNAIEGKFDVALPKGEDYHLVWWNPSRYDTRLIEAETCFSYPTP